MKIIYYFFLIFIFSFCVKPLYAQIDGTLDSTFGTNGFVTVDFNGGSDIGFGIAIQNDGKIIVVGKSEPTSNYNFALARLNTDGTLDNTFGTAGKVTTDIGGGDDDGRIVVIQNDGKVLVAGNSLSPSGVYSYMGLARYNTNGSLDNTFSTDGKVSFGFGTGGWNEAYALAIQTDGKIIIGGSANMPSSDDFAIARLNTDGTIDATFNTNGKVTTDFSSDDICYSLAIQPDGKILAAGITASSFTGDTANFALVRYKIDGSIDSTFGTYGKVKTDFYGKNDNAFSVVLQPDGKIILAGDAQLSSSPYVALARYNINGTLDSTFGTNGKVITTDFPESNGRQVVLQTDGKIIVAGFISLPSPNFYEIAIFRFNTNGTIDSTFNGNGMATSHYASSTTDIGTGVAIQQDKKIVEVGYTYTGTSDFAVVRYLVDQVVGINNTGNDIIYDFTIFPNPANDRIEISNPGKSEIQILNIEGQLLKRLTANENNVSVDISDLSKGLYFVKLISEEGICVKKFIKE
jgi:uncharacterized delta-60 repeat protein